MSHLDEGLLTALLDNELEEAERRRAEAHLAECGECRQLLEEVKAYASEADGLVAAVELPPQRASAVVPVPVRTEPPAESQPRRAVRPPLRRTLAWAASIVLAAGLGWMASDLRYGIRGPDLSDKTAETDRLGPTVEEPKVAAPAPARAPAPLAGAGLASKEPRETQPALQERANNAPASPSAAPPPVARDEAARAAERPESRTDQADLGRFGNAAAQPTAPIASATGVVAAKSLVEPKRQVGFRQVDLKEAVRTLGGSIRLMDGLQPERILISSPPNGTGTESPPELVRVVYQDPPGRELWLDQQRSIEQDLDLRARNSPDQLYGDTIFTRGDGGSSSLRWVDQHGFRLALTGFLGADSLRVLMERIH